MERSCLCCQKPLDAEVRYHPRCLGKLFGVSRPPSVPFGAADFPTLVAEHEGRMSISGVQMKLSVRLRRSEGSLESVATGGTHILKPETDRFDQIPQNENLCMNMAKAMGLRVPPHGLFALKDGKLGYIVKRFDRLDDGTKVHKETVFQILGAKDKYSGSLEAVGKAILAHVVHVGLDAVEFFERVLFCFLTGNGDMHLKNWALLGVGQETVLAPCYDLVCSRIYIAKEEDSALTINGRTNKLRRADFMALAEHLSIDPKAAENSIARSVRAHDALAGMIVKSELRTDLQRKMADILSSRSKRLSV